MGRLDEYFMHAGSDDAVTVTTTSAVADKAGMLMCSMKRIALLLGLPCSGQWSVQTTAASDNQRFFSVYFFFSKLGYTRYRIQEFIDALACNSPAE